ncbi:helix-turn-helix domain-containing protein [Streptomyces globisporus]|uniref:helix-turn-helix domain-containing protein n=1 Tax=Streptomyces globisporus TaxID=1908 RepID=UPI0036DD4210
MPEAKPTPWSLPLSEVGVRLEELRENRGLTQNAVAKHEALTRRGLKIDASGLSRLEGGQRKRVSRDLVEGLLEIYQANEDEASQILALLATDTTPAGRPRPALWRRNAHLLGPMQFEGFLKMERRAAALSNYERDFWPGLLQIEDYAYLVITQMRPDLLPSEVKELVDVRMDRQQHVKAGALAEFRTLVEERALHIAEDDLNGQTPARRHVHQAVWKRQLERVLNESEDPPNSIRILPRSAGIHPGLASPFVLMNFPEAARQVVWVETMVSSMYFDGPDDVQRYEATFDNLWNRALSTDETRTRLRNKIKELAQ